MNSIVTRTRSFKSSAVAAIAAVAIGASAVMSPALAQDAGGQITDSHLQAARAAIAAIDATDRYDGVLPEIALGLKSRLIQSNPDLENEIITIVDEATISLVARRADLENEAAAVYARAFSEQQLQEIAAFYATEAGQALINNGPIVAREVAAAAVVWRRGVERDLLEEVGRRLGESGLRDPLPASDGDAPATE